MNLSILGSTGSIGTSTLDVVRQYPDRFDVMALAAGANVNVLAGQIVEFRPRLVSVASRDDAMRLRACLSDLDGVDVIWGPEGAQRVGAFAEAEMVVAAISGSAGLLPTLSALQAGKTVALANKESLVMAGELVIETARRHGGKLIPVDSEHSAVFQLLKGHAPGSVRRILLTASGGPFLDHSAEALQAVTPEQALQHPRWKMGRKVTTDSATMMNKGLEVIEAHWLFGLPADIISVVVHPQSIIHSMVELVDGSVFAQLSTPDMKGPIAYALSCPQRLADVVSPLDLVGLGTLTFQSPDEDRFPALALAYRALRAGGLMAAVMNGANEVAVEQFHERRIGFSTIARLIERVMERFPNEQPVTLENVLQADTWARTAARSLIDRGGV